jgi:hypothetical protein
MAGTLRGLLIVLGVSAIAICLSIVGAGPTETAWAFEGAFDAALGRHDPLSTRWPPTMDSELRFYAPLFGAYGVLVLSVARDMAGRRHLIPWIALVFFLGGMGRAVSWAVVGAPHPLFLALMAVELILPGVLIGLARASAH